MTKPDLTPEQTQLLTDLAEMARKANPEHPERVEFEAIKQHEGKALVRVKDAHRGDA